MLRSETIGHLAEALAAAQGEFEVVKKDNEAQAGGKFSYKYADLASIVAMASPVLTKHALAVAQFPETTEPGYEGLTTLVMHSSGEWVSSTMSLLMPERATPQQQGSAITYARRYAYGAVLGIVTDVDDDGAKGSEAPSRPLPPPQAPVVQPDGEIITSEDMEARRQRVIAEARARGPVEEGPVVRSPQTQRAQAVAERLATRTRPSPRRPMP